MNTHYFARVPAHPLAHPVQRLDQPFSGHRREQEASGSPPYPRAIRRPRLPASPDGRFAPIAWRGAPTEFPPRPGRRLGPLAVGEVQDPRFLSLLKAVGQKQVWSFDSDHLLVLDLAYRQQSIPADLRPRIPTLVEAGILERAGRWVIPSQRLMAILGEKGR